MLLLLLQLHLLILGVLFEAISLREHRPRLLQLPLLIVLLKRGWELHMLWSLMLL